MNDITENCKPHHVYENVIEVVKSKMPSEEILNSLAEFYKVFGDGTRIKILYVLLENEMCVCDIAELLGMTQSAISHQLKILKTNKLVKFRKSGKSIFYSLTDSHVEYILNQGYKHITE